MASKIGNTDVYVEILKTQRFASTVSFTGLT